MSPKQVIGLVLMLGPLACAVDGQSSPGCTGGCSGEVQYPHTNPEASPTDKSMRLRITEAGFDSLASALPDLLASSCQESDGDLSASCELDPNNPNYVRYYIGEPCAPVEGSLDLWVTQINTSIRSGPCNNVNYHRSAVGMHLDSFRGNIHMNLIQDSMGDGIEVVLGCNEEAGCTAEDYVRISLDMVWNLAGFGANNSCEIRDDDENNAGMVIESFRMIMRPKIQPDAQGRPQLILEADQVDTDDVDLDFNYGLYGANSDPACPNSCWLWCTTTGGLSSAVELFMEQELIATFLADAIVDAVGGSLTETGLEATGQMEVPVMIGASGRSSNPMLFSVGPNEDSPDVTGPSGQQGLNFDIDTGYWGPHSNCVPEVTAPSWLLPEPIDPGFMVQAPDPTTGELAWEVFDMAFLLGDVAVSRLAYSLFDSGNLCLPLGADAMSEATDGAFVPNIGLLSLVAPGLGNLGDAQTPVLLALAPNYPPHIQLGDGSGEGAERNSHIQLTWPGLELEFYPLLDDVHQRVLAFSVDVEVGISLEAAPNGNLKVMVDEVQLANPYSTYNEIGTPFDPQAIGDLVETFLPIVLGAGPFTEIDLSSGALGVPVVPKIRAIDLADDEARYLGFYFKLCTEESILDSSNALCFEQESDGSQNATGARIRSSGAQGQRPGNLTLVVEDAQLLEGPIEMAYRVDGAAWRNFRGADIGTLNEFTIQNGALRWPGWHSIEVMTRSATNRLQWSKPMTLSYLATQSENTPNWTNLEFPESWFDAPLPGEGELVSPDDAGLTYRGCAAFPVSSLGLLWLLWLGALLIRRRL